MHRCIAPRKSINLDPALSGLAIRHKTYWNLRISEPFRAAFLFWLHPLPIIPARADKSKTRDHAHRCPQWGHSQGHKLHACTIKVQVISATDNAPGTDSFSIFCNTPSTCAYTPMHFEPTASIQHLSNIQVHAHVQPLAKVDYKPTLILTEFETSIRPLCMPMLCLEFA